MQEKKFAKGLFYNPPRPNAPNFVKGSLSVKVEDFTQFLMENVDEKGYVNIDMLLSKPQPGKKQKISLFLNEWKPKSNTNADTMRNAMENVKSI